MGRIYRFHNHLTTSSRRIDVLAGVLHEIISVASRQLERSEAILAKRGELRLGTNSPASFHFEKLALQVQDTVAQILDHAEHHAYPAISWASLRYVEAAANDLIVAIRSGSLNSTQSELESLKATLSKENSSPSPPASPLAMGHGVVTDRTLEVKNAEQHKRKPQLERSVSRVFKRNETTVTATSTLVRKLFESISSGSTTMDPTLSVAQSCLRYIAELVLHCNDRH